MSAFLNANLPSEDEEDQDFVPSEDDEPGNRAAAKKPTKKRKTVRGAAIGTAASPDAHDDDSDEEEDGKEIPEHKQVEKKAKMDELWNQLNSKKEASKPSSGVNLAALCKPVTKQKKSTADQSWAKQLGLKPKSNADNNNKNKPAAAKDDSSKKSAAAAALAAAKAAASVTAAQQYGMVSVTETRRFAGKDITMVKQVAAGSKEAEKAAANGGDSASQRNKAGLDAVLASLAQAKKVGVLDKSRADWKDFKKSDDAVDEELEIHKRSGEAYLDKQAFLGRAEVREYERERDARLSADVRNRGRL